MGLPLGLSFALRGLHVTLLDLDPAKVNMVNAGQMPFRERGGEEALRRVAGRTLSATLDARSLQGAQAVVTVVGTPVDRHLNPTVNELYRGVDDVLQQVADGTLFVLRSTVYPGVTRLTYTRINSLGRRIPLAFCPERIAEGRALEELESLPQIVSAFDLEAMAMARELFLLIAPEVIELDPMEAELAKLFTNSWRYLNFAISNQFFTIARRCGLDFYRVYEAVTRDYPRMKAFSRPGFAAGPCLLKDTLQLAAFCDNTFFMGHAAMLVNEGLPNAIVAELREGGIERQCVAILGMAFKGDSDDKRESLSYRLRSMLSLYAREVVCTDPYVSDPSLVPLDVALGKADVIVLGAPHAVYRSLNLPPGKKVVDIWNFWERGQRPQVHSREPSSRPAE